MSAREALEASLDALDRCDDPAVVISRVPVPGLVELAARIDAADPSSVPLRGTTFTVKDNIDVEGTVTTAGCPSFGTTAGSSSFVVRRLIAAGALPVAKTNLDQFATGLVGVRSPYGTARNPFDPALVPGGSSSGSAVSVARSLAAFSLGTDTAGSGRVPAAMCGIVGLKPTRGWLSTSGVVPAVRSIDCVSVFATEVDLAWRVACAAGGHDPDDPMSRAVPPTSRGVARTAGVLAVSTLHELGVAAHIVAGYQEACDALADAGVTLHEVDLGALLEVGSLLYGGPWVAERFASVGEFLSAAVARDGGVGLDPVVRSIIEASSRWTAVDAQRAGYRLAALRAEIDAMFDVVDVLVTPTIAREATLAEVAAEPLEANARLGCFTTFSNLADLCALALPVPGTERPGLPPVSVSLHGPAWSDEMLVRTAALLRPGAAGDAVAPRGWITVAVAGAHLRGQPLEHQLTERRAVWLGTTASADTYRLYALPNTVPPKPGLVRVGAGDGTAIELDVWALPPDGFGTFVDSIPAPLCIGTVELADGTTTSGFLCEPGALDGATDITSFGGWRAYRASV